MDFAARLETLLHTAEEIGLIVQKVPISGDGGGLCVVKGERRLFVDTLADTQSRYERTLAAMAALAELDNVFLPPQVREDIDRERGSPV